MLYLRRCRICGVQASMFSVADATKPDGRWYAVECPGPCKVVCPPVTAPAPTPERAAELWNQEPSVDVKTKFTQAFTTNPVFRDQITGLFESAKADRKAREMTDKEFADLLNIVLDDVDITDVKYGVISQAIDRLKRSNAGPFTEEDEKALDGNT